MIVRDLGSAWQVVMQTDHADLAAGFAHAWADPGPTPAPAPTLRILSKLTR